MNSVINITDGVPVTMSSRVISDIPLKGFGDGPRARDLDIADRLGFTRARKIRELIERNMGEFLKFGSLAPQRGKSRGQEFTEYWLNEEQALLAAALSDADRASEVRHMLIKVFVAWRRGDLPSVRPADIPLAVKVAVAREGRLQYRMFASVARQLGLKGNQAVLSANRATRLTTGFDVMGSLGITHVDAQVNQPDLVPTTIANRLGLKSAQEANKLLVHYGYQHALRDYHGHVYYELTPKGQAAGGVFKDTDKRTGRGVPIKQLMWASRIVDLLRSDIQGEDS